MRPPTSKTAVLAMGGLLVMGAAAPAGAASAPGAGQVEGGFYSEEFHADGDLDALGSATGKRVTLGGTFISVEEDPGPGDPTEWSNTREKLEAIWRGRATPFANLDIPADAGAIAGGGWDSQIQRWVDHLLLYLDRADGRTLVLAPLQEMNGDWTPYGCHPTHFRDAYRRIVDIVRGRGIDETRVRFAFAPNAWTSPGCGSITDYYPGDDYVDIIGISAFRWADGGSIYQVMGGVIDELATRYPTKPLLIAQAGAWPSSTRDEWIREMFTWAAEHPHVVALIYFNFDQSHRDHETDWRVWTPDGVDSGWKDGMLQESTSYQWPLRPWFGEGPLTLSVPSGENTCPPGAACDTTALQDFEGRFAVFEHPAAGPDFVDRSFLFGNPGDVAFSGDWNCDGTRTLGLYRRSTGAVYLKNTNTQGPAELTFLFGNPGDVPLAGDFDGDGCDTVSIYRPSEARFYMINRLGEDGGGLGAAEHSFVFGNLGDSPFVGDFDGDGVDTVGVHRDATADVYLRDSNATGAADDHFVFGNPGDQLIAGDWDGDGKDTVAVYRRGDGRLYLRLSNASGRADSEVYVGAVAGLVSIREAVAEPPLRPWAGVFRV